MSQRLITYIIAFASVLLVFLGTLSISYDQSSFLSRNGREEEASNSFHERNLRNLDSTKKFNMTWLKLQIDNQTDDVFLPSQPRLEGHIRTDKVIYRPNDVIFIEVLLLNAMNKSLVSLQAADPYFFNYQFALDLYDPSGQKIFTNYQTLRNSTIVFNYKVPKNAPGGEYQVQVSQAYMPTLVKLIRIRDYPRDDLIISGILNLDSYRPGDKVNGKLTVSNPDGSAFSSIPTFSYSINFATTTFFSGNQTLSVSGEGFFNFDIPKNTTLTLTTIGFIVALEGRNSTYGMMLVISQPSQMVIDFFPETGNIVPNVTNKIYFQAWASKDRADSFDFVNASLKVKSLQNKIWSEQTLISQSISTVHRGKGFFYFTPNALDSSSQFTYLEITLPIQNSIIQQNLTQPFYLMDIYRPTNEVVFSVLNQNRVLNNSEPLNLQFMTNSKMNSSDSYVLQVRLKEQILFQDSYSFNASQNYTVSINSANFSLINGGILTVSLYKLTQDFIVFYSNATVNPAKMSTINYQNVSSWLAPRGEIIFFKKPNEILKVNIKTDKTIYAPGDKVSYTIEVINKTTNKTVTTDAFVSVIVTDDSVFSKVEDRKQPASLASRVYLEDEVARNNYEFYFANQYIEQFFQPSLASQNPLGPNINIELLLGVQGWRAGIFDVIRIFKNYQTMSSISATQKNIILALYGSTLNQYWNTPQNSTANNGGAKPGGVVGVNIKGGPILADDGNQNQQDEEQIPNDYMVNIANPRFWAHPLRAGFSQGQRVDLTETVLFASAAQTKNGTLQGQFFLSDLITRFRIIGEALNPNGVLGYTQSTFNTQKILYINFDVPTTLQLGDVIKVGVNIVNLNSAPVTVNLYNNQSDPNLKITLPTKPISVAAGKSATTTINVTATNITEQAFVNILATAIINKTLINDSLTLPTRVLSRGFPRSQDFGGMIGSNVKSNSTTPSSASFIINLPSSIEVGSQSYEAKIMSSNFASLLEAINALIQDPYGCFEQTSSTTYPMVMGLSFLKALPMKNSQVNSMILQIEGKLKGGYNRLLTFKTKEKGYEWFGQSPAHESLSSYGLMQFTEMSKVTTFVDQSMVKDLRNWILSRRNGKGSFLVNPMALDSFGRAPANITDAYIVWALTSSGVTNLTSEITALKATADASIANNNVDAYFLGLLSGSLYNLNRKPEARVYANQILKNINTDGSVNRSLTTITTSDGSNRIIETTSISVLAWLNEQSVYASQIQNAVKWLLTQVKQGGAYGSTQATILALKALTTYMQNFTSINGNGTFTLRLNNTVVQKVSFTQDQKDAIQFNFQKIMQDPNYQKFFKPGQPINVSIALEDFNISKNETKDFKINYAFSFKYYDQTPVSYDTPINFTVAVANVSQIGQDKMNGQIFSYNFNLTNPNNLTGRGMTVAIIRPPSCLAINFDFLEALQRNNVISYYQVQNYNSEIVLYWRQLMPGENKQFKIDFIQRYAGICNQKPHTAYLYYNDDNPVWILAKK